jgi:hypothetical protein
MRLDTTYLGTHSILYAFALSPCTCSTASISNILLTEVQPSDDTALYHDWLRCQRERSWMLACVVSIGAAV